MRAALTFREPCGHSSARSCQVESPEALTLVTQTWVRRFRDAVKWAGRTTGSLGSREGRSGRDRQPRPRPHRGHVGTAGRLLDGLMGNWPSREMHSSSGSWSCRLTSVMGIRPSTGLATAVTKPMPVAAQEGWREGHGGCGRPAQGPGKITTATPAPPRARAPTSPDQLEELVLRPGVDLEGEALQHAPHPPQIARHIGQPHRQPGGRGRECFAQLSPSLWPRGAHLPRGPRA